jgi:hypothetical protein
MEDLLRVRQEAPLTQVVRDLLWRRPGGMLLREIVQEVTGMIREGRFTFKARSVPARVRKALDLLKRRGEVEARKPAEGRVHRYILKAGGA